MEWSDKSQCGRKRETWVDYDQQEDDEESSKITYN
jgi:hypothetical protein